MDFLLPDVGEGLTEADILSWAVEPGDVVEVNQILCEIETAKAAVELPSPFAGVVSTLHAAVGDTLAVGLPLITITEAAAADAPEDEPKLLVGYGARPVTTSRRRRIGAPPVVHAGSGRPVAAKPPVRKLAKDLGIALATVAATGPDGTITRDDVRRAVPVPAPVVVERSAVGDRETRIPIRGVRKHTAAAMVRSAFTAPHATEFVTFDITATMELRDLVAKRREFRDVRLSPLAFVAKALVGALARTPEANSSWDEERQEIVRKHYVNLGVAAATDRGLVVPNLKGADRMSLLELARGIADLTVTARAGRTTPADLTGGTVTITNVGVFGIDTGTPILNPGEAAILALGAIRRTPWVVTDASGAETIQPRWTTTLALSFDHRLVDGAQGSRVLADTAAVLEHPGLALL